jgi:hypothetical protein
MDVFRTAAAQALAYAGPHFNVSVYPHLPDLGKWVSPCQSELAPLIFDCPVIWELRKGRPTCNDGFRHADFRY